MPSASALCDPVRIECLRVRNFRVLRDVEFKRITPLMVLLGPNGSGKSTVFDVFAFLAECFESGLRQAWDRRGRAGELKTRGSCGPVVIEIEYREAPGFPLITYHLSVDEHDGAPVVEHEWLRWRRCRRGGPFRFLEYRSGAGYVASGEHPGEEAVRVSTPLRSPDLLAVNALGQFQKYPRVATLRDFISGWHLCRLAADSAHTQPEAGPHRRLSGTGGNLANVIQYLGEQHPQCLEEIYHHPDSRGCTAQHPQCLEEIFAVLRRHVLRIESVTADVATNGRLVLRIKDAPFDTPVLARFASDGTVKLLACLVLLHAPEPPLFIGMEEPENFLHPRLLPELAEECAAASERTQMLVTTHSPFFLNALHPDQVRVLWRDEQGHTRTRCAVGITGVREFTEAGAQLGHL